MIKVKLPRGDGILGHLKSSLRVINEIEEKSKKKEIVNLDFSEIGWFNPCSMILLSNKLKELSENKVKVEIIPPEKPKVKEHMRKIGFPFGNSGKGSSFVPIRHFKKEKNKKHQVNKEVNKLMDEIEDKVPRKLDTSIKYILGELSDNIDEHSNFSYASLMAQYFPKKKKIDIAVFDNGITIPGAFSKHDISFQEDGEAIQKAVKGEVTTKKNEEMRGYGLKSCKRLSIEGLEGEFYIISRKGILGFNQGKKS